MSVRCLHSSRAVHFLIGNRQLEIGNDYQVPTIPCSGKHAQSATASSTK